MTLDDHRQTSDWRTDSGMAAPGMAGRYRDDVLEMLMHLRCNGN